MELITFRTPKNEKEFCVCFLGDIQYTGKGAQGATAIEHLKRHVDYCLENNGYFIGTGDYIDFMSPSNRKRLVQAGLYDTAKDVIWSKALEVTEKLFDDVLAPTKGRWVGMVEGHHFSEFEGQHTDEILSEKLGTKFLGTSAFIYFKPAGLVVWVHHGAGSGQLPSAGINRLYHVSAGLTGGPVKATVYASGHNTKLAGSRLARPYPTWGDKESDHDLEEQDVILTNCGGFAKSNIPRHRVGGRARGDYAEQAFGMTPSPLNASVVRVNLNYEHPAYRFRLEI